MVMRLLQLLVICLCAPCASAARAESESAPTTLSITSALSIESDSVSFPAGLPLRTVSLPDQWSRSRPGANGPVWYRVAFSLPPSSTDGVLWAVRASHLCSAADVYLNGRHVYRSSTAATLGMGSCNAPELAILPPSALQPGTNVLDLRVTGRNLDRVASRLRAGALSPLVIGPHAELAAEHEFQRLVQSGLPLAMALALIPLGGYLIVLGWRAPRRDSHLGYFGALLLVLALAQTPYWLRNLPIDDAAAEFLLATLMPFLTWAAVQFLLRYAGRRERIADIGLPIQCAVMPLSLIVVGPANVNAAAELWGALMILEFLTAAAVHLAVRWPARQQGYWVMGAALVTIVAAEVVAFYGVHAMAPLWVSFGRAVLPLVLMLMGLRLLQQRGAAVESAEANRALLEQRVAEVKAEIESNYRQLSELRVVQVTDRERKRIAADLHDDLGAKLLTIVHTSESERISTLAREALEEMRLSVRGLTGKPVRLEDALGDWRAEVISRLGQAGIEAVWNMPVEELPHTLPARAFVQTTRIIREAVNNIIKHSGASQCAVRCQVAEGDFQLVIQDNGKGISVEVDGRLDRGHGLSSMKGRAKQLQGQCLVESGPGYGTVIRLTIPLEAAPSPA